MRTPQGPSRSGLYLIEGIRHLARAVEENAPVESVFYAPSALSNTFGQRLVRELRRDGAAAIEIASALYREITLAADPQGLVAVIGAGADPHDPAAIRATMRAIFAVKLARATIGEFARWARSNDVAIVGSSPSGHLDHGSIRYRWPAELAVGSEKRGLSPHLSESCDFLVRIPMAGRSDSINAAVASGLLLYELAHQRR